MLRTLENLTKAALALAAVPVAAVADVCALPASAYDGRKPFGKSATVINAAASAFMEAVKPEAGNA